MDFLSTVREFATFMWERKLFWMAPVIIVLLFFGVLIVMSSGSSLAPFIYTLF